MVPLQLKQKIWTLKIDWDESLPVDIHTEWTRYYKQLPLLNNISLSRQSLIDEPSLIELHGFSDASERTYGTCIYIRSINIHGHCQVQLLMAKSKVAPLKSQSIPRLELYGTLRLSSLVTTAQKALNVTIKRTIFWTDSVIVLHWLQTSPYLLKTFVANRVTEIQNRTKIEDWRHVPTADNPADLISRGQLPEEFLHPSIWHHGPKWLCMHENFWPTIPSTPPSTVLEQRKVTCLTTILPDNIIDQFFSWEKLIRVIAWCLRWKPTNHTKGALTAPEIRQAHDVIIRLIQKIYFAEEIKILSEGNHHQLKDTLRRLNSFLDCEGILRVGGRLKHSIMPFSQKHPIILPKIRTTTLIIEYEHRTQFHAGIQATLYAVR
nr:PREDICTED: uncharacterized protein LOC105663374 isoform X1 [Megachile rotundata]XP_012147282.1 PREDICTED: uncharacterized protein LOC105663374 isoform X1 [Megachile rotundata]XP_012147283.1 PREDICTED: uncharacterized protein LOC105663374 isoform X1 [Megachile rotundata]XP_012147284.1 PREDICTED: uncharacterized protein LOC105663374 isoform X1 [Megachile rotundata]XP_012147285.1 PREDICTED: uncharacterized protein LOC105663374 isoform X1 [Megachile rotundata]XP_012147286.1 PREDICTED: uncharact